MLLKLLSPISVLAGVVLALGAFVYLSPLNGHGTTVVLFAFCVGAGFCELVTRLLQRQTGAQKGDGGAE